MPLIKQQFTPDTSRITSVLEKNGIALEDTFAEQGLTVGEVARTISHIMNYAELDKDKLAAAKEAANILGLHKQTQENSSPNIVFVIGDHTDFAFRPRGI